MKKTLSFILTCCFAAGIVLSGFTGVSAAETKQDSKQAGIYSWEEVPLPHQIQLREAAVLYEAPSLKSKKGGTVSVQEVYVTGVYIPDEGMNAEDSTLWVQIRTWLGERWILIGMQDFTGKEFSIWPNIALLREESVFSSPNAGAVTDEKLEPQTVELKAIYGLYYQVMTSKGLKWIKAPGNKALYDVSIYETELELTTNTPIFGFPELDGRPAGWLAPQKLKAFENASRSGWYHVQTWLGPMWVHPFLSMPEDIISVNETVTIQNETLYLMPNAYSKQLAEIDTKVNVKVFERSGQWMHINYGTQIGWVFVSTDPSMYAAPKSIKLKQLEPEMEEQMLAAGTNWYGEPLAVHMDVTGLMNYTRSFRGSDYGTEMKLIITFGNLTVHDIEIVEPAEILLEINRVDLIHDGADKETPVWQGIMPVQPQMFRSGAEQFENHTKKFIAVWDQRDADGILVPPGDYMVRFKPFTIQYMDGSGELKMQQVDSHIRSMMWFTLLAPDEE